MANNACAVSYAKRFSHMPPLVIAACMTTCATFQLTPLVVIFERPWAMMPIAETVAALLALGIITTAVGFTLYFKEILTVGGTNVLLATYMVPVLALLLGTVGLNEVIG